MKTFVFELNTYMSNQNLFYSTNTVTKKTNCAHNVNMQIKMIYFTFTTTLMTEI